MPLFGINISIIKKCCNKLKRQSQSLAVRSSSLCFRSVGLASVIETTIEVIENVYFIWLVFNKMCVCVCDLWMVAVHFIEYFISFSIFVRILILKWYFVCGSHTADNWLTNFACSFFLLLSQWILNRLKHPSKSYACVLNHTSHHFADLIAHFSNPKKKPTTK